MSVLTVVQSKSSNHYTAATNYKSATCAAVGSGNSLAMIITALTAELPFVIEPQAYNGTTDVPMVLMATDTTSAGMTRHLYKLDNITHAPTSIRYKVNASSGSTQQASEVWEIGNTGASALTLRANQKTTKTSSTSFTESWTAVSANELAIVNLRLSISNPVTAAVAPYSLVTHGNGNIDSIYNADVGAAGAKTASWTTTNTPACNVWIVSFSNTSLMPTVTTVTGSSVTEGTANRFTVALSGTTANTAVYAASFGGDAVAGTDYDSNLASATYSAGASYVGGQIQLLPGYSSCTIDVPTVDNALDQADRTLILTVGGVASTGGTILDNDPLPNLTIGDAVESFGVVTIPLTLDVPSGRDITFNVSTVNGSKTAGTHFTGITNQLVTITAGNTTASVPVTVL